MDNVFEKPKRFCGEKESGGGEGQIVQVLLVSLKVRLCIISIWEAHFGGGDKTRLGSGERGAGAAVGQEKFSWFGLVFVGYVKFV